MIDKSKWLDADEAKPRGASPFMTEVNGSNKTYKQQIAEIMKEVAVEKRRIERKMRKQWERLFIHAIIAVILLVASFVFL